MLHEFGSRDFSGGNYELCGGIAAVANYGRAAMAAIGSYVVHHHHSCYPNDTGENAFNLAWDGHQQPIPYHSSAYQPSLHGCPDLAGFLNSVAGGSSLSRPSLASVHHHLRHPRLGQFGPNGKQPLSNSTSGNHSASSGGIPNGVGGGSSSSSSVVSLGGHKTKPRRRVASVAQRRAANIRERRRMYNLNTAFDRLRKKVPTFAYEKRLSRIETLRLAITYISFMKEVLQGNCSSRENEHLVHGPFATLDPNTDLGPSCNENLWANRSALPQLN